MANGTLTEEEERLLMERAAARAANPAINLATDLSASYVAPQYPSSLDVFRELVPDYTQYTPQGDTWLGGTGPQIDELGNVKVWRGETTPNMDAVSGVKYFGLDPAPSNWASLSDPSQQIDPHVTQAGGGFTRYGTITPEEAIHGYGYAGGGSSFPDMHEVTLRPSEAAKVVPGGPAVAETIHTAPSLDPNHPAGPAKAKAIQALTTPLPGTGVETSMLGKYGPALKGAGRFLGLAGYPMSAMAASDYWGAGKPVRAAMAAGSALPVVGPGFLAAEMLTNAVADGIQPQDARDFSMGGGGMPGPGMGGHPGMGMAAGYDVSGQTPGLAGTQTGMPVAVDAGGAVGGYPTMDADYGTMATEESDYVPDDPTGGLIDIDALAGRFDVGPTSMAQVGGIPSGRTFGVPTSTDLYSEAGVPMSNENLAYFGAAPVSTSPSMNADYTAAFDATRYSDPKGVIEDALAGILGGTINPADVAVGGPQLPGQQAPYGGPMMDTSLQSGFGKIGEFTHYKDLVDKLVSSGAVKAPTGYVSSVDVTDDLSLPGIQHAMSSDTYGYQSGLKAALANEILGVSPTQWGLMQDVQNIARMPFGGGATKAMQDAQKQEGTRAINAALASPEITAQDQIDAYNAASMGEIASHPGQGGYIGDTERTIGEHLAAVDERVQAMPAVTTPQALAVQDERQQAMPEVSVPAPTAPTVAAVAAQDRLAQMQADAAMAQAAQEAALRDQARQAAQRAAVEADIAAAQAEQDRVRQANALMNSKSYQESGLDGLSAAERDVVAAAQVDTFAGINRQVRGDRDTSGERSAGMGGGRGGFAGPDRW